jgi:hypothetical protein
MANGETHNSASAAGQHGTLICASTFSHNCDGRAQYAAGRAVAEQGIYESAHTCHLHTSR